MSYIDTTSISDDTRVEIQNMTSGTLSYTLPSGIRRNFSPHMRMTVTAGELRELGTSQGGLVLLQEYLCVHNPELAKEFGVTSDVIEYNWTEKDIRHVLLEEKDINVLLDALDFAPSGIVDELIHKAIEWKIPDGNKIKAISAATGLDIDQQIKNQTLIEERDTSTGRERNTRRRIAQTQDEPVKKQRRVQS